MAAVAVPVTSLYASVFGLYHVYLSAQVIVRRIGYKVAIGDGTLEQARLERRKEQGGDITTADEKKANEVFDLKKAVRAQGNFAEYVPLSLILLGIYELNGGPKWLVHTFGVATLLGRILHGQFGVTVGASLGFGRGIGTIITLSVLIVTSVLNLYNAKDALLQ